MKIYCRVISCNYHSTMLTLHFDHFAFGDVGHFCSRRASVNRYLRKMQLHITTVIQYLTLFTKKTQNQTETKIKTLASISPPNLFFTFSLKQNDIQITLSECQTTSRMILVVQFQPKMKSTNKAIFCKTKRKRLRR